MNGDSEMIPSTHARNHLAGGDKPSGVPDGAVDRV